MILSRGGAQNSGAWRESVIVGIMAAEIKHRYKQTQKLHS